jgi:phosphoribosyl-ATP pyrophosphohydrolase/phosphoribosyl-AMP cyclohydrolase
VASEISIDDKGLVPAIAQDAFTGRVLMIAYMNDEAIEKTVQTGQVWFYSRSRQEIWHKGETSGNFLDVRSIQMDCDGDALLLQVYPHGPACHTGNSSCFYQELDKEVELVQRSGAGILEELAGVIHQRNVDRPEDSYTTKLLEDGTGAIAQKVIEEAGETVVAALSESKERLASETADLLYHTLVLLEQTEVPLEQVWKELDARRS